MASPSPTPATRLALNGTELQHALASHPGWSLATSGPHTVLEKTYCFANYPAMIAFVNALAWIAERMNHHPVLHVHYDRCVVQLCTHDAQAITALDLDFASRADALWA